MANDEIPENELPDFKDSLKPGGKVPVECFNDLYIIVSGSIPGYSFGVSYFRTPHEASMIKGAALTKSGRCPVKEGDDRK